MSRPIVFLDFDGVLVNRRSWYVRSGLQATGDPPCIEALNRIIRDTGAAIVVSSSWRIGTELIELRQTLKRWGVKGDVIGKTPHFNFGLCRGREIADWMRSYSREIPSFVILDDDTDMGELLPYLVKCEFDTGLTEQCADKAIKMLSVIAKQQETK